MGLEDLIGKTFTLHIDPEIQEQWFANPEADYEEDCDHCYKVEKKDHVVEHCKHCTLYGG